MKKKHHGLVRMIIFCLAIGTMIVYGNYISDQLTGSIQMTRPDMAPQAEIPDASTMAYIQYLTPHLEDLGNLKPDNTKADLKLFGYATDQKESDLSEAELAGIGPEQEPQSGFSYKLSLSFSSKNASFCIIDGKLYKEKASMPDKAEIIKIENDRVLIKKQTRQDWVYSQQIQAVLQ